MVEVVILRMLTVEKSLRKLLKWNRWPLIRYRLGTMGMERENH